MARLHLVELEDLPWFPPLLRRYLQDVLRFAGELVPWAAEPSAAEAERLLRGQKTAELVDLAAGAGGISVVVCRVLRERHGVAASMTLTDLYPHQDSLGDGRPGEPWLRWEPEAVDATQVPERLPGLRLISNAFHHFDDELALAILADAQRQRAPLLVTELVSRTPRGVATLLAVMAGQVLVTPWIRPFRWSRLALTYLVPLLPALVLFDGLVSCLRVRSPAELRELVKRLPEDAGWRWTIKVAPVGWTPGRVTLLVGEPAVAEGSGIDT